MNLPNWITVGRIVLVPVFLVLAYGDSTAAAVAAFAVFVIASLSDFVDGYLRAGTATVSRLGEFLDPLADKLLVGAALFVLVDTRDFPLWAAARDRRPRGRGADPADADRERRRDACRPRRWGR